MKTHLEIKGFDIRSNFLENPPMIQFYKYDATGNDFIIIHDPNKEYFSNLQNQAAEICHRNHGIGADGILLIHDHSDVDFEVSIINSDGTEAEMCANGTRACIHLMNQITGKKFFKIKALGGDFAGQVSDQTVALKMESEVEYPAVDLSTLTEYEFNHFAVVGVPHAVIGVDNLENFDVEAEGKRIRHLPIFKKGTNVNFISEKNNRVIIRTFERGVEGETLSCGTGVMATAAILSKLRSQQIFEFETRGGKVGVEIDEGSITYTGQVRQVYKGELEF